MNDPRWSFDSIMLAKIMISILDEVPTAKERDKGHWIDIDLDTSVCSVCKKPQEYETNDILLDNNHFAIYSDTLLYLLTGIAFVKKKPFCPKYGEMVYYVTVSGYIQEVRFDTDSTLHQLLRKAGKLYRSEEEAKRYLDKDYKDLIIQEKE